MSAPPGGLQWPDKAPDGDWNPYPAHGDPSPPFVQCVFDKQVARRRVVDAYVATHPEEPAVKAFRAYYSKIYA